MSEPRLTLVTTSPEAGDEGLRRARLAGYLRHLLGAIEPEMLEDLEQRVTWVRVARGERLFRQGDPPDGAYIVALGRLDVVVGDAGGERVIDEVGPGQTVGEMALLTRKERSATVYAARDSELVWLSNEVFEAIVLRYPRLLLETTRILVSRLQRQMAATPLARRGARTFAIAHAGGSSRASAEARWFTRELARCLGGAGSLSHVTAATVDGALGKPGIAQTKAGGGAHLRLSEWLMEHERAHDIVLYETDPTASEWTARALRHADHILLVADGESAPDVSPIEASLAAGDDGRLPPRSLILLQPEGRAAYPGTRRWLAPRSLHGHHHVRRGRVSDVERVARLLTGNAVGVVFGGGGARGYAHIGVVRALAELGIPVDAAGGSSIGAVIAMSKALEMSAAEMLRVVPPLMRAAFFDPTLPLVSLMRGKHTLEGVQKTVGNIDLEDFVLPLFAVSTNLTRGEQVVHRTGPATLAIRASGSVPGIFPPVPWNGDLLVDGGLSNNVPADVMASLFGPKVVAVDVIPEVDLVAKGELAASMSGFDVAWRLLNPFAERVEIPSILSTLMRSATTSARGLRGKDASRHPHALYLEPAVSRWNMIDFSAAEAVAEDGYRGTREAIAAWWSRVGPLAPRAPGDLGVSLKETA